MTEYDLDDRCEFDDGEFTCIDDREYPELTEPARIAIHQLAGPAASTRLVGTYAALADQPAQRRP